MDQSKFISIALKEIMPETELPVDIYLYVSGHFVKYRHCGDVLQREKYDHFIYKKVAFLFVTIQDYPKIEGWAAGLQEKEKEEIKKQIGGNDDDLVDDVYEVKNVVFDILTQDITDESAQEIQEKTRKVVAKVAGSKVAKAALARFIKHDRSIADHCSNVANMSVYLAHNLGYTHQLILENIYLGALLHDYGKTQIDPKYLDKARPTVYKKNMRAHPEIGRGALKAKTTLPDAVIDIVGQHHERQDGKGYPKAIKGGRIYDLVKIVSIANFFDNLIQRCDGDAKERYETAIMILEKEAGKRFDRKKLEKAIKALRLIY